MNWQPSATSIIIVKTGNRLVSGCINLYYNWGRRGHDRFYWFRKPEYPEKTTDLSKVTYKLNIAWCIKYSSSYFSYIVSFIGGGNIMLYQVHLTIFQLYEVYLIQHYVSSTNKTDNITEIWWGVLDTTLCFLHQ
jgi:hypothetical protein